MAEPRSHSMPQIKKLNSVSLTNFRDQYHESPEALHSRNPNPFGGLRLQRAPSTTS